MLHAKVFYSDGFEHRLNSSRFLHAGNRNNLEWKYLDSDHDRAVQDCKIGDQAIQNAMRIPIDWLLGSSSASMDVKDNTPNGIGSTVR